MKNLQEILKVLFIVLVFFSYSIAFLDSFEYSYFHFFTGLFYNLKKILIVAIGLSIPFCSKNKSISYVVVGLGTFAFILANVSLRRSVILQSLFFDYFGCLLVFYSVVSLTRPFSKIFKYLLWGSRILCVIIPYALLTQIDDELAYYLKGNYMFFANAIMVPLSIEIYSFIVKKNILDALLAIVSIFFLFMGSRGSMLSMLLLVMMLYYHNNKTLSVKNLFFICIVVLAGVYILGLFTSTDIIDFSDNRTINFFTKGTNWADEDRFRIWLQVINGTSNVFFGDGIFADRQILMNGRSSDVAYAHNVFVESFSDFGVVGLLLMLWIYTKFIKAMIKQSDNQLLIIVFFFISAFQLLFSRSMLLEYNFFILAGLVYISTKKCKQNLDKKIVVYE